MQGGPDLRNVFQLNAKPNQVKTESRGAILGMIEELLVGRSIVAHTQWSRNEHKTRIILARGRIFDIDIEQIQEEAG